MVDTPAPNGKLKFREEFISWNTVKHLLILLGVSLPIIGGVWAWTSTAQAQSVQLATSLKAQINQNDSQHNKYDAVLISSAKAIESNSRAIDRVAECIKNHLDYEKQTDAKIDGLMTEQRHMTQRTRDEVVLVRMEQGVLRDEIKRLAEEVRKNGTQ